MNLTRLILIGLLIAMIAVTVPLSAQELPKDAQALVTEVEQQATKLRSDLARKQAESHAELIKQLKQVQENLTKEGLLDEALAVRNYIRTATLNRASAEPFKPAENKGLALPSTAALPIAEFERSLQQSVLKLEQEIQEQRKSLLKQLGELQTKYTKAGQLDEAVAIRNHIATDPLSRTVVVIAATPPRKPELPSFKLTENNVPEFLDRYRTEFAWLSTQEQAHRQAILDDLIPRLKTVQKDLSDAGNLDGALAVRALANGIASRGQSSTPALQGPDYLAALPAAAQESFKKSMSELTRLGEQTTLERQKLTDTYAAQLAPLLTASLNAGRMAQTEALLQILYQIKRHDILQPSHQHPISDEARAILNQFEESIAALREQGTRQESSARQELLEKLKEVRNTTEKSSRSAKRNSVTELQQQLETEDTAGIVGGLLITRGSFPQSAQQSIDQYRAIVWDLKRQQLADIAAKARQYRDQLQPHLTAATSEHDFDAAYGILKALAPASLSLGEIPVGYAPHPVHPPAWEGLLIDLTETCGKIERTFVGRKETFWLDLDLVRLSSSPAVKNRERLIENWQEWPRSQPPGESVKAGSELQIGQELLLESFGKWQKAIVVGIGPEHQISIQRVTGHAADVESVPRSACRLPVKPRAASAREAPEEDKQPKADEE